MHERRPCACCGRPVEPPVSPVAWVICDDAGRIVERGAFNYCVMCDPITCDCDAPDCSLDGDAVG